MKYKSILHFIIYWILANTVVSAQQNQHQAILKGHFPISEKGTVIKKISTIYVFTPTIKLNITGRVNMLKKYTDTIDTLEVINRSRKKIASQINAVMVKKLNKSNVKASLINPDSLTMLLIDRENNKLKLKLDSIFDLEYPNLKNYINRFCCKGDTSIAINHVRYSQRKKNSYTGYYYDTLVNNNNKSNDRIEKYILNYSFSDSLITSLKRNKVDYAAIQFSEIDMFTNKKRKHIFCRNLVTNIATLGFTYDNSPHTARIPEELKYRIVILDVNMNKIIYLYDANPNLNKEVFYFRVNKKNTWRYVSKFVLTDLLTTYNDTLKTNQQPTH